MAKPTTSDNIVCRNRKAAFRFELLENLDCGIELKGAEVKSLRERNASIEEAYARLEGGELWLIGAHIAAYGFAPSLNYEPTRKRKLLVHRQELRRLKPKVEIKGQTLVPIKIYFNERGIAKITIALARGKRLSDKRETIKAREHKREMDRAVRRGRY